ncbi:MAG: sigma-70 family RNA polymerase sigma factor [Gammaproteobacteria bacterium]|nr:sigma-70 family RNA polymerase sigma factor [Gammaproteobacteria bacterium]
MTVLITLKVNPPSGHSAPAIGCRAAGHPLLRSDFKNPVDRGLATFLPAAASNAIETMTRSLPQIDNDTIAAAEHGDSRAQAAIYRTFSPYVYTLARRMLASRTLAEDALQATFVEMIHHIGSYRADAEFGFWLRRIAVNQCLMLLRSPWSARRHDQPPADGPDEATDQDARIGLARALDQLPPLTRVVVWLHDVEGLTHREIGQALGYTASFSKSQLARAHERLRTLLTEPPHHAPWGASQQPPLIRARSAIEPHADGLLPTFAE